MTIARVGSEFVANSTTLNDQFASSVTALADGRFVVTFTDNSQSGVGANADTSGYAVRARIFNADGTQSIPEFLVNTTTISDQNDSRVTALADGRFVVIFTDRSVGGGNTSGSAVKARIFNTDGTQSVPEFLVSSATSTFQSDSSVTVLADGRFVVTFSDESRGGVGPNADGSGSAVRARIFNIDGTQSVPEFLVNITTARDQSDSNVTALVDGRFVVTFTDTSESGTGTNADDNNLAVRARIFNADGSQSVPEFLVNKTTSSAQFASRITALADGGFVVTFTDGSLSGAGSNADASDSAIRARIFNADGSQSVPEFLVNTTTANDQSDSSVTALADGRFIVTWTDLSLSGGDTSGVAVRARIFNRDGTQSVPEFLVNTTTGGSQGLSSVTALADGRLVVTFSDFSQSGGDTTFGAVRVQVFDPRSYDGTSAAETVTGGAFDDNYFGYGGADVISGRGGDDFLSGGEGSDTLNGDDGNDRLSGGGDGDLINGGTGDDQLRGEAGSDQLFGGDGNDYLNGGAGGDVLNGGAGWDSVRYDNALSSVDARLYNAALNTGEAAGDSYIGIEQLVGGYFSDVLYGDGSNNIIAGLGGDDVMDGVGGAVDYFYGGDGRDQVFCRSGADVIDGGNGFDYARYDYASVGLRAYLYDSTQNSGDAAGDYYTSVEALVGTAFGDDLRGDAIGNIISGGNGNDFIVGLAGADLLNGGAGVDSFFYSSAFDGGTGDLIEDFVSGTDRIMVDGSQFGLGSPGGVAIDAFRFVSGASANLATTQFGHDAVTGEVWYDFNGTGGGGRTTLAYLQAGATLVNTDILVL
jgi:Ca2+-binding RTX toxin-like protein